jgi:hypothetical protein
VKLSRFKEIWFVDTEFTERPGERVVPICLVAHELYSGRWVELWEDQLSSLVAAPFDTGLDSLVVAYASTAEMLCFKAWGWDEPENLVDLYAEYRVITGDTRRMRKYSLLEAMAHYRLNSSTPKGKWRCHCRLAKSMVVAIPSLSFDCGAI